MSDEVIDAEFEESPAVEPSKKRPSDYTNAVAELCEVVAKPASRIDSGVAGKLREHASTARTIGEELDAVADKGRIAWDKVKELSAKAQELRPSPVIRRRF